LGAAIIVPEFHNNRHISAAVKSMLSEIKARREAAIGELALKFDHWEGDFVLSE